MFLIHLQNSFQQNIILRECAFPLCDRVCRQCECRDVFLLSGNKYIHILTETPSELRVELMAWDNSTAFAKFSSFMIGDEKSKYILTISGYSGTAGKLALVFTITTFM